MNAALTFSLRFGRALSVLLLCLLAAMPAALAANKPPQPQVDRVEVYKTRHEMRLIHDGAVVKIYRVALGRETGKKEHAGDNRTPEGSYTIDFVKRHSVYHRALHISYPNPADFQDAVQRGERPGGNIMIHGLAEETPMALRMHRLFDWTRGCIAVTNKEIEELATLIKPGTPIAIYP
ncbi:MAG: L,D-transpeptidase family protein [Rhodospirillaceae bacterium]